MRPGSTVDAGLLLSLRSDGVVSVTTTLILLHFLAFLSDNVILISGRPKNDGLWYCLHFHGQRSHLQLRVWYQKSYQKQRHNTYNNTYAKPL